MSDRRFLPKEGNPAGRQLRDDLLRYLVGKGDEQWPASVRECAAAINRSVSVTHYHLEVLIRDGWVERGRMGFRARRAA